MFSAALRAGNAEHMVTVVTRALQRGSALTQSKNKLAGADCERSVELYPELHVDGAVKQMAFGKTRR